MRVGIFAQGTNQRLWLSEFKTFRLKNQKSEANALWVRMRELEEWAFLHVALMRGSG